jgi:hypothetical protein
MQWGASHSNANEKETNESHESVFEIALQKKFQESSEIKQMSNTLYLAHEVRVLSGVVLQLFGDWE